MAATISYAPMRAPGTNDMLRWRDYTNFVPFVFVVTFVVNDRYRGKRSGISAITYVTTAIAAAPLATSSGAIRSTVSAGV